MKSDNSRVLYKIIIALAFGLIGFFTNFYPLNVLIPPNKASFVWGLVFPMLISLSWGWRWGLLSATLGLGAQTMWFLWLPKNGWAVFVAVPIYNLWIVWHGWCAKNIKKGILSTIYGADIPYRIFFAIMFSTVFAWSFKFNPSPWAPQMTLTTAPPAFIHFIQFKVIFEGYIILLLADVLRNLSIVKKILLIDAKSDDKSDFIISGAMLFGLVFWIASSIAAQIYSTDNATLADSLILKVSHQHTLERLFIMLMCLVAGLIISNYFSKYRESSRLLRVSETHYKNLFSSIRDVIVIADKERNITNINQPAFREQFGYELEQVKGEQTSVLYASNEGFQQTGKEVYNSEGKTIGKLLEFDLKRKDGTTFPSEMYASKLLDENNEIIGNLGIIRDITERKISEMKLREANNIINRSPVVAFLWKNTEGWPVEYVSLNVESLFGYSDKEFTDGSVSYAGLIHPDDIQRVGEEVSSFSGDAARNEFTHKPYRIIDKNKNVKWVEDITHKRIGDNGVITHFQGIVFDITPRVEAEATINNSLKEKEVLLKEVHHRVKNNMAVISSLLALQAGYIDEPKYLDMFEESQSRIRSMVLVHEKLYQSEDFVHIDIRDYIDTLMQSIKNAFAGKDHVALKQDVENVSLGIDLLIPCGLIINEILTNAFKHAFDGQDNPELRLSVKFTENEKNILTISDNGKGFPEGFDLTESAGLGLKLVNVLVKQLNGTMEVKSECGVEFTITFPLKT